MFKKRGSECLKNGLRESSECINYDMLVKLAASGRNKRKTTIKILVYWKLLGKSKICFSTSQMVVVTFLLFGGDVSPGFRVHRPQPEVWRQRSPPWSQCCSLRRPKSYTPEEEKNTKNAKKKKRKERMRVCMYVCIRALARLDRAWRLRQRTGANPEQVGRAIAVQRPCHGYPDVLNWWFFCQFVNCNCGMPVQ